MSYRSKVMAMEQHPDYAVDRHQCGFNDARDVAAGIATEADQEIARLMGRLSECAMCPECAAHAYDAAEEIADMEAADLYDVNEEGFGG